MSKELADIKIIPSDRLIVSAHGIEFLHNMLTKEIELPAILVTIYKKSQSGPVNLLSLVSLLETFPNAFQTALKLPPAHIVAITQDFLAGLEKNGIAAKPAAFPERRGMGALMPPGAWPPVGYKIPETASSEEQHLDQYDKRMHMLVLANVFAVCAKQTIAKDPALTRAFDDAVKSDDLKMITTLVKALEARFKQNPAVAQVDLSQQFRYMNLRTALNRSVLPDEKLHAILPAALQNQDAADFFAAEGAPDIAKICAYEPS